MTILIFGPQARLAVHLQSIIEKFPHDSTISLANASELNETVLSSSISALKASGSIKSSHSTKSHRRLTEIVEDAGETTVQEHQSEGTETAPSSDTPVSLETNARQLGRQDDGLASDVKLPSRHNVSPSLDKALPDAPNKSSNETLRASHETLSGIRSSVDEPRSLDITRPSTSGPWNTYKYKPKVKLAPRPSADHGSSRSSDTFSRPVSTLPAGIRLPSRQPAPMDRTHTQQASSKPFFSSSGRRPFASTAISVVSVTTSERPSSRAGSTVSTATAPAYANYSNNKPSTATLEKQRLMKALQKRKKNQMAKIATKEEALNLDSACQLNGKLDQAENEAYTRQGIDHAKPPAEPAQAVSSDAMPDALPLGVEEPVSGLDEVETAQAVSSAALFNTISTKDEELVDNVHERPSSTGLRSFTFHGEDAGSIEDTRIIPADNQPSKHPNMLDDKENISIPDRISTITPVQSDPEDPSSLEKSSQESTDLQRSIGGSTESMSKTQLPQDISLPSASENEASDLQSTRASISEPESTPKQETFAVASPLVPTNLNIESEEYPELLKPSVKEDPIDLSASESKVRERTVIAPIKVADAEDTASLSGDSFLDELQTATVEEAKTVTVSKSPATSFFPGSPKSSGSRRSSEGKIARSNSSTFDSDAPPVPNAPVSLLTRMNSNPDEPSVGPRIVPSRSFSSPIDSIPLTAGLASPTTGNTFTSRTSSVSPTQKRIHELDLPVSKKSGVSSLISQRIKALEKFSSSNSQPSNTAAAVIAPALVSKRSASIATPPASSGADTPLKINPSKAAPYPTPSPSPHGNFAAHRFRPTRSATSDTVPTRDSVTVTAKIVRDVPNSASERPTDISQAHNMNLHNSPLIVQHKSSSFSKASKKSSRSKSRSSTSSVPSPRNSIASAKSESFSSRRSNASREDSLDTLRPSSHQSSDVRSIDSGDKKESRRSRLMKRMSAITFSPRRTIAQALHPTLSDQPIIEHQEPEVSKRWGTTVTIGDFNVQFPDTLVSYSL